MLTDLWISPSSAARKFPNDYGTAFFFGSSELSFKKTSHYKSRAFAPSSLFDSLSSPSSASSNHARPGGSSITSRKVQKRKNIAFSLLATSSPTQSEYLPRAKKQKIVQRAQPGYKFACLPCAKYYIRRQDLKKHYTLFHDGAVPPSFELVVDPTSSEILEEPATISSSPMDLSEALQIPSSPPEIDQNDSSFAKVGDPSSLVPARQLSTSPIKMERAMAEITKVCGGLIPADNLSLAITTHLQSATDSTKSPASATDQGVVVQKPPCKQEELDFINFTTAADIPIQASTSSETSSSAAKSNNEPKSSITQLTSPLSRFISIQSISSDEDKAEHKPTKDEVDKVVPRGPASITFKALERLLAKSDSETSLEGKEASLDAEYKPVLRTSTRVRNRTAVASVPSAEPRATRTRTKFAAVPTPSTSAAGPDISTAQSVPKARKQSTVKAKPKTKRPLPALSKEESMHIDSDGESYSCKFCKKNYAYLRVSSLPYLLTRIEDLTCEYDSV